MSKETIKFKIRHYKIPSFLKHVDIDNILSSKRISSG